MITKLLSTIFILTLSVVALVPKSTGAHETTESNRFIMHMTPDGYDPKDITIPQGATIVFENTGKDFAWPASNIHPTHSIYPEFDPKESIKPGASWEFTFNKPGVWKYHDHVHPTITGTITVVASAEVITNENISLWSKVWKAIVNFWKKITRQNKQDTSTTATDSKFNADVKVTKGEEAIFSNTDKLASHLKKFGAKDTITQLRLLEPKFGSCHQPAHKAGHIGYQLFGDKAFTEYSAECQSGYYHGVMEAYLQINGADNLETKLGQLCKSDLNAFFEHQCIHGIGHGLDAWESYDLPVALADCDKLPRRQDSCWTGVFMENLGAKLATDQTVQTKSNGDTDVHVTKWLSSDPLFPCNAVENKYQSSCYFLQTSRMLQIFGIDYNKVAGACNTVPSQYQASCFGSMGRDVGGSFPTDMSREIKECGFVADQTNRIYCLNGAVQNSFWDPSGQDLALSFCGQLTITPEKASCYDTIFERAPQVITSPGELNAFCSKAEFAYQPRCKQYARI